MQKILLTALFITSVSVATETPSYAYVYDDGLIPLRYEKEIGNNTVLSLQNGEQVEVLKVSEEGKWSKVKYGTTEGWIVSKFIVSGISAKDKLSQLVNENKQLAKRIKELREHHNELEKYNRKKAKEDFAAFIKEHQDSMLAKYELESEALLERNKELILIRENLHNEIQALYLNKISDKIKKGWRFDGAIN